MFRSGKKLAAPRRRDHDAERRIDVASRAREGKQSWCRRPFARAIEPAFSDAPSRVYPRRSRTLRWRGSVRVARSRSGSSAAHPRDPEAPCGVWNWCDRSVVRSRSWPRPLAREPLRRCYAPRFGVRGATTWIAGVPLERLRQPASPSPADGWRTDGPARVVLLRTTVQPAFPDARRRDTRRCERTPPGVGPIAVSTGPSP